MHMSQEESSEQCWPETLEIEVIVVCRGDGLKSLKKARGGQRSRKIQVEEEENSGHPKNLRINPEELFGTLNWLRQGGDHVLNLSNHVTF